MSKWLEAAKLYRAVGWHGTLPLSGKQLIAKNLTGYDGGWPSDQDLQNWGDKHSGLNLAIRVPRYIIGLDIDAYKEAGAETLERLEDELGELPPTWITTSKMDGVSGIRLYRVDPDLHFVNEPGPGIEIVQFHHRYATVWPSIHPTTHQAYIWLGPNYGTSERPPYPHEATPLPDGWAGRLRSSRPPGRSVAVPSSPGVKAGGGGPDSARRQLQWWITWARTEASERGLNNALNKAAWELRPLVNDGKLDEEQVISALLFVSARIAGPEYESKANATIRSGLGLR